MSTTAVVRDVEQELGAVIDDAFADLEARMQGRGESFAHLGRAIRRAGRGGKRFRPALVVRSFRALGGQEQDCPALLPIAAAFELLHTAFVVHDDVIDGDTVRRGIPNVSGEVRARAAAGGADPPSAAALGDAAAILAGDLLLHEAQRVVRCARAPIAVRLRILDLLDDAVLVSAAGELADVEQSVFGEEPDLARALSASHDKTAVYSFSAPLRAGAALARADGRTDAALERFGARLGLAYQLVDDLIGAFGSAQETGRDAGVDLVAARTTPLTALAHDTDGWPTVRAALALARTGPIALRDAQRAIEGSGAPRRLRRIVRQTIAAARADVRRAGLPPQLLTLLLELSDDIARRIP